LLKEGANQNTTLKHYQTPLLWAVENGHETIVRLLLANPKVDPNSKGNFSWTPLLWAVENGHETIVRLLLANPKVDPDSEGYYGWTPLSRAVAKGHEAVAQLLKSALVIIHRPHPFHPP